MRNPHALARNSGAVLAVIAALFTSSPGVAQLLHPASRQITTSALAIDTTAQRVYAVDTLHDRVLVFDQAQHHDFAIPVGKAPIAFALDSVAHIGYSVDAGSGSVSAIDLLQGRVVATIPTDTHPYAIAVDTKTHRVYVSNTFSQQLTMIDGQTNIATSLDLGSKDAVLADVEHGSIWLSGYNDDQLELLEEQTLHARKLPGAKHLWAVAVEQTDGALLALSIGTDTLLRVDRDGKTKKVTVGSMPDALARDPASVNIYVANYAAGTVTVVDKSTFRPVATIKVGNTPQSLALDTVRGRLYVANTHDRSISVVNTASAHVIATLPIAEEAYQLAIDPKTGNLFAATYGPTAALEVNLDSLY